MAVDHLIDVSQDVEMNFYHALETATAGGWFEKISYHNPDSKGEKVSYPFVGGFPNWEKFTGSFTHTELTAFGLEVNNEEYSISMKVKNLERHRDRTGQIALRANQFGEVIGELWGDLAIVLLDKAPVTPIWTNDTFFGTNHQWGGTTQRNKINIAVDPMVAKLKGTFDNPSSEQFSKAVFKAIAHLLTLKDDTGRKLNKNSKRFVVVVPLHLQEVAMTVATEPEFDGIKNPLNKAGYTIEVEVEDDLSSDWDNSFSVWNTSKAVRGLIRQDEIPAELIRIGNESSWGKMNQAELYMAYASRGVGYGNPFYCVMATLVATQAEV